MGYLDGWWGRRSDDPLQDLDPKTREFLRKESPIKYDGGKTPSGRAHDAADGSRAVAASQSQAQAQAQTREQQAGAAGATPEESQYQDGRYAHLWKTYRPLAEVENDTKTDAEKLQDVLEAFKARKTAIGSAALENCADEQMDWSHCMRAGSLRARMTMCSDEVRKFERCFNMQSRLLKTLGYLNAVGSSPETDERIQMHADKLYHQMLEQDAAVELAKKEGRPAPTFESVIPKQEEDAATEESVVRMSESARKRAKDKLEKLKPEERAAEEAAIEAEMRSKAAMVGKIRGVWKEQDDKREERLQKGEATLWDKAAALFKTSPNSSGENKN